MTAIDHVSAIHEAAHAVLASCAGFDIREVVLHPAGGRAGEGGRCVLWDQHAEFDTSPLDFLVFALAGNAAEQRLCGRTSVRGARDIEIATAAAVLLHDGVDPCSTKVLGTLRAAAAIANGRMHTDSVWRAVEYVDAALRRRRRLTGRDIQLLVRAAQR